MKLKSVYQVVTDAVKEITSLGFSYDRMRRWSQELRVAVALSSSLKPPDVARALSAEFVRATAINRLIPIHPGVSKFSLDRITPLLRPELDRRILASADLIKLNRESAIEKTIQRFSGWATSIPEKGSDIVDKIEVKEHIVAPTQQMRYEENRVLNDQGLKMISAINDVVAEQTGAIAGIWHSHFRQPGYDYREDHKERNDIIYLIRDSWAHREGLIKVGPGGYTDQITRPAEEVNCQCYYVYITSLRELPVEMLTAKGKHYLGIK